jgi:hypothetical protein
LQDGLDASLLPQKMIEQFDYDFSLTQNGKVVSRIDVIPEETI